MARQQTFDFSERHRRRLLLDRLALSSNEVHVLKAIHAKNEAGTADRRLGVRTICEATSLSRATVHRVLAELREKCLVAVTRTGRASVYAICWPNVEDYDQRACTEPARAGQGTEQASGESRDGQKTAPVGLLHEEVDWSEVAAVLAAVGVTWEGELASRCAARGESPADVAALADQFREGMREGRWRSPGALYLRLKNGTWPEADATYQRQRQRAANQDNLRREAVRLAQQRAEAERERLELQALEDACGARLESLSDAEVLELAGLAVGEDSVRNALRLGRELRSLYRLDLLRLLRRDATFTRLG